MYLVSSLNLKYIAWKVDDVIVVRCKMYQTSVGFFLSMYLHFVLPSFIMWIEVCLQLTDRSKYGVTMMCISYYKVDAMWYDMWHILGLESE